MNGACSSCTHWKKDDQGLLQVGSDGIMGTCKRYPPTAWPMGADPTGKRMITTNISPMTAADDYCGEHTTKVRL